MASVRAVGVKNGVNTPDIFSHLKDIKWLNGVHSIASTFLFSTLPSWVFFKCSRVFFTPLSNNDP